MTGYNMASTTKLEPDALGHWGPYGGRFVPETLMAPLEELTTAYEAARLLWTPDTSFLCRAPD
jgi:tryptophan synthase beta chain